MTCWPSSKRRRVRKRPRAEANANPLAGDRSRLRQFEHFSGVLVPVLRGMLRDTQAAFELANQAIKQRAESVAASCARTEAG